jgi:hypothetical protein
MVAQYGGFMKKILLTGLIFSLASLSSYGVGLYFDAGIGVGPAWTTLDGEDVVDLATKSGSPDEMAVDLGLKLGAGPFNTIPIYLVGVLSGVGHRITYGNGHYQFNSYLIGPGVVFYPAPFVQVAGSLGFSFLGNETSASFNDSYVLDDSKGGFAGDISVAADVGTGNHALLVGLRFFGSTNTLERSGVVQNTTMISIFVRYAFRHKR